MRNYKALLQNAMRKHEMVSVHDDAEEYDMAHNGLVESVSGDECRMRVLSQYGIPDGLHALRLADIRGLDVGGLFERRIAYFAPTAVYPAPYPQLSPITRGSVIGGTLRQAKEHGLLVTLWIENEKFSENGFVREVSDEVATLDGYDMFGAANGQITVDMKEISAVSCGDLFCQRTQHLIEHQQEFREFCARQKG